MASIISAGTTSGTALNMAGDTSGVLELATNGSTTAITIDTSQNVGIGLTPSGSYKLEVASGSIKFNARAIDQATPVSTSSVFLSQTNGGGTFYVGRDTSTGSDFGTSAYASILYSSGAYPMVFTTNSTERMRIESNGTVLIGTTTPPANNGYFNVNGGDIACTGGYRTKVGNSASLGGNRFNINWTGSAAQLWIDSSNLGTFAFTSDYRIKKNIETNTTPALERIAQIRPVTYEFADYQELFKADGVAREGFIAHELAEVIPSAVEGEKDAEDQIQSLKLDALCSVMVKAIQEQQTIINDLKARITALEGAA
jgi:hypothetical protein